MRTALVAIGSLVFALASVSIAEETYQITGHAAELIVKKGDVLTSQCEMGKETWWFCNVLVKVTEPTSSPKQGQGIWMCKYGLWPHSKNPQMAPGELDQSAPYPPCYLLALYNYF